MQPAGRDASSSIPWKLSVLPTNGKENLVFGFGLWQVYLLSREGKTHLKISFGKDLMISMSSQEKLFSYLQFPTFFFLFQRFFLVVKTQPPRASFMCADRDDTRRSEAQYYLPSMSTFVFVISSCEAVEEKWINFSFLLHKCYASLL